MSESTENVCRWRSATDAAWLEDDIWDTDCGHRHIFFAGGPNENECRFCCYCGKPLKEEERT